MPSSGLHRYQACMWYKDVSMGKISTHKKIKTSITYLNFYSRKINKEADWRGVHCGSQGQTETVVKAKLKDSIRPSLKKTNNGDEEMVRRLRALITGEPGFGSQQPCGSMHCL